MFASPYIRLNHNLDKLKINPSHNHLDPNIVFFISMHRFFIWRNKTMYYTLWNIQYKYSNWTIFFWILSIPPKFRTRSCNSATKIYYSWLTPQTKPGSPCIVRCTKRFQVGRAEEKKITWDNIRCLFKNWVLDLLWTEFGDLYILCNNIKFYYKHLKKCWNV